MLVHADNRKRLYWVLAVVESLIIGKDRLARAANIKARSGRTNRPIKKLYPLETSIGSHGGEVDKNTINTGNTTPDNVRPKRQAAQHAMDNIFDSTTEHTPFVQRLVYQCESHLTIGN